MEGGMFLPLIFYKTEYERRDKDTSIFPPPRCEKESKCCVLSFID